jgi:hypothetical protein
MEPLAPGLLITTVGCASMGGRTASAMARAVLSLPPPGW